MNDSFLCPLKALANQNASYNRDHLQISLKSAENIADNFKDNFMIFQGEQKLIKSLKFA